MPVTLTSDRPLGATTPAAVARGPALASSPASPASPFAQVMHALGREAERGEGLVRSVLRGAGGQALGPGELLALQAGIYRYGETVDLAAKLVDKAGTDVKTVLQGQ